MSEKNLSGIEMSLRFLRDFCGGVTLTVLVGCGDPCANKILSEARSPDGKYVATAFIRDGGATTGSSPQVHLRPFGAKREPTGNVFVGEDSDKLRIEWLLGWRRDSARSKVRRGYD
jgi:hypothetical protein